MAAGGKGHNGGVFGGDEAAALLAGLWSREGLDRAVDAGVVTLAAAVLGWQGYKRPKTTGAVAAVWLLWFACKLAEGQSAWEQFSDHASHARGATEEAVHAVGSMLAAWAVLLLPIVVDVERVLSPIACEAGHGLAAFWNLFTWQQRGLVALCTLALGGTAVAASTAVAAVQRHKSAVGAVLFQLSFAVCGPCLWWLTARLPSSCSGLLVGGVVSVVPLLLSVRALLQLEGERKGLASEYAPLPKTGLLLASEASPEGLDDEKESCSSELQQRMCAWLAYWSCWPFFHMACMIRNTDLVPDETKPAVDGLLLALAAWAQVWQASRIAPYLFVACAGCLSRCSEQAAEATSAASSSAMGLAGQLWQAGSSRFMGEQSGRWAIVAAAAATLLVLASLVLQAMALASALLTLGILLAVAVDSARCAACGSSEALPSRLAFWVVSISWLWLCSLPLGVGALLAAWTPVLLTVAAAAAELLLKAVLHVLRAVAATAAAGLRDWGAADSRADEREASAADRDTSLMESEEEGSEEVLGQEAKPSVRHQGDPEDLEI